MDLATFLKLKRTEADLSQAAVAKKLGYTSPQFVSNWERGLSRPPIPTLKKIAQLYNVDPKEMFDVILATTLNEVTDELTKKYFEK